MNNKKISLCITNYNRTDMVIRAFEKVLDDPRISEIIICDDASTGKTINELRNLIEKLLSTQIQSSDKIKLLVHATNVDCYLNKKRAIAQATNEWCILFDSDNILDTSYIDALYVLENSWDPKVIYAPDFAKPHFDYSVFSGETISEYNVAEQSYIKPFECLINTCNYFVNRDEYFKIHDSNINPHTADTAYFNYKWIEAGNKMFVVPGMQYEHTIHDGSHYKINNHKTGELFEEIMYKFRQL